MFCQCHQQSFQVVFFVFFPGPEGTTNSSSTVKTNYHQNWCLQLNPSKTLAFSIFTLSTSETNYLTLGFQWNTAHVILSIICLISALLWPPNRTGWKIKTLNAVLGQHARQIGNSNSCAFQTPSGVSHNVHAGYCVSLFGTRSHVGPSDHTPRTRGSNIQPQSWQILSHFKRFVCEFARPCAD